MYIERKNSLKAVGLFRCIVPDDSTQDHKLLILGTYNSWFIHPSHILDFQSAKSTPDTYRAQDKYPPCDNERPIEYYRPFLGFYVYLERKNDHKAIGTFSDIVPGEEEGNEKLLISGKYNVWFVHPSMILDFQIRHNRSSNGGGRCG